MSEVITAYLDSKRDDLIAFTSDLIQIESYTTKEKEASTRVVKEMQALGYDDVKVDSFGSVMGRVGNGKTVLLYDAHIDVVEALDGADWKHAPFSATIEDGCMHGRGTVDTKSSVCAMVYAGQAMKELGLLEGKTVYISASVGEEDYDGFFLENAIREHGIEADFAIIGEPSDLKLAVGHRGRSMYTIRTTGKSAHGSAPHNGVNAIYKMAEVLKRVEAQQGKFDLLTGEKGSVVVSNIDARTASLNAIPDQCTIYLDRRLALGETEEIVGAEMDAIVEGTDAKWEIYRATGESFTGKLIDMHVFLPAWETKTDHPLVQAGEQAIERTTGETNSIFKWEFATNGFATNGPFSVPTIGVGPGEIKYAHMKDENCKVEDIMSAAKIYTNIAALI
ncbi:YgeY family selenium metabolism-linked hydrolase [Pseudovibrio sp. Tun.PSC04-5.I4]|uniref:YgeY family selenium metabolism-linked hydrolase n=1 Tax=Pseudovibrio sp. Tun.PSC04-5.I4 TaxID=1798213 RepID=UPI000890D032|nr:YgeY family selenium metabolism-linked hydrolase [Pseudovibrio sp. Tun.PSC04-5.I4]SDQ73513.1 putative selenium metabolism hydrolase [Pseudovibrio sp. Tun.PSC04-5.I4]